MLFFIFKTQRAVKTYIWTFQAKLSEVLQLLKKYLELIFVP